MTVKNRPTVILVLLLLAACGARGGGEPAGSLSPTAAPKSPEIVALEAAEIFLEGHLGRELQGIQVAYGPAEWPDAGMGCPEDGVEYEEAPTSGYEFEMTVEGATYRLHTNADGSSVLLCPAREETAGPLLPPVLEAPMARSRELVAQATGVSSDTIDLQLLGWEQITFSSTALACPQAGNTYLDVLTEGYSLQLGLDGGAFEVHTDLTGVLAVLCEGLAEGAPPPAEIGLDLPQEIQGAFAQAQALLAGALALDPSGLVIEGLTWERTIFPSSALGCPQPEQAYMDVETEGYIFMLTHGGMPYAIHTDLAGAAAILCEKSEMGQAPAGEQGGTVFSSYSDAELDIGTSYPLGWAVQPNPAEAELYFGPAGDPGRGMIIGLVVIDTGAVENWLSDYQLALYTSDPTAVEVGERESAGPGGLSQRYSREVEGLKVMQRCTFFPSGYRVIQWAPESEWLDWDEPFMQILDSLVLGLDLD